MVHPVSEFLRLPPLALLAARSEHLEDPKTGRGLLQDSKVGGDFSPKGKSLLSERLGRGYGGHPGTGLKKAWLEWGC